MSFEFIDDYNGLVETQSREDGVDVARVVVSARNRKPIANLGWDEEAELIVS